VIDFAGLRFKNPFVVASGPLTASIDLIKRAEKARASAVSTKLTLPKVPFRCQLRPYSLPGFGTITPMDRRLEEKEGLELVRKAKRATSLIIFANISAPKSSMEDWQKLAREFEEAGVDIIEANFSCPNIGLSRELLNNTAKGELTSGAAIQQVPMLAKKVTRLLKESVKIPVVCKLSAAAKDLGEVAEACEDGGADGISIYGGSVGLPPPDIYHEARPLYPLLEGASFGGLTGPQTKFSTYRLVAQVARRVKIPIVASGGIGDSRDAIEMMMWGATLVSACTSIMWYGFEVVEEITRGIENFLKDQNYSSCKDLVGKALQYLTSSERLKLIEGYADVDRDKCDGCGICLKPGHCQAIELQAKKAFVDSIRCLGCGICVALCPREAIELRST